jgi:hypothetical protein
MIVKTTNMVPENGYKAAAGWIDNAGSKNEQDKMPRLDKL